MTVNAVLLRLPFKAPVMTEPMDEVKSRGRSFRPDMTGLLPSAIWKRWGRLKAAMKKMKPEQSVTLRCIVSEVLGELEIGDSQNGRSDDPVRYDDFYWEGHLDRKFGMSGKP